MLYPLSYGRTRGVKSLVYPSLRVEVLALNLLVGSYDAQHLNEPKQMETALREVLAQFYARFRYWTRQH